MQVRYDGDSGQGTAVAGPGHVLKVETIGMGMGLSFREAKVTPGGLA